MTQTVDGLNAPDRPLGERPGGQPGQCRTIVLRIGGKQRCTKMISREEQANYQYNTLYQLTDAVYEKQPGEFIPEDRTNESYQYDGVGNRTKLSVNQAKATSHYNAFNQLIQQGNTHFEYDANGNLIKRDKLQRR